MKHVTLSWRSEANRFVAEGGHAGHTVAVNAPHEGEPTGFSASELLLAAAAACSAWDVVEILRKKRQPLERLEVSVEGEQRADPPWPYERIELVYRIGGPVDPGAALQAVELSVEKYCAVIDTVRGRASISHRVELEAQPGPAG